MHVSVHFTDQVGAGEHQWIEFERFWNKKRNIPTNRTHTLYEKNEAISPVIMFTPGVAVIKLSKMAHFLYFLLMTAKNSHSLGKIFKRIWKLTYSSFSKCYRLLGSELPLPRCQPLKKQDFGIFADWGVFLVYLPLVFHKP